MNRFSRANILWFVIIVALVGLFLRTSQVTRSGETVDFRTFMEKVEKGEIKEVTIQGQQITGVYTNEGRFRTVGPELLEPTYNTLVEHGITPNFLPNDNES